METSIPFQTKTVPEGRGDDNNKFRSLERKNISKVEIRADKINIINIVKNAIIKIFSLRKSLKTNGNSSWLYKKPKIFTKKKPIRSNIKSPNRKKRKYFLGPKCFIAFLKRLNLTLKRFLITHNCVKIKLFKVFAL